MEKLIRYLAFAFMAMTLCACAPSFRNIKVEEFSLKKISPSGLKAFDAVVGVKIDNQAKAFRIVDLGADVKVDDKKMIRLETGDIEIGGKTVTECDAEIDGTLEDGLNIIGLVKMVGKEDLLDKTTVDIQAKIATGKGNGRKFELKNLPLKKLMGKQ